MSLSRRNKKLIKNLISFLILANIISWFIVYDLNKQRFLEITYFDIDQGDSIFIETGQNHQILIDGGPTSAVLEKLADEMPFYDRSIDLVILTHPEHDHYYGLFEVLKRYEVENILWTGVINDTDEWKEWKRLIEQEGAEIKIAQAGQRIVLQKNPFIFIDILYPFDNLLNKQVKKINETSIVSHLFFKQDSFLFTGDITKKQELELVDVYQEDLQADVLKIAHHGSKTSSSQEILDVVSPQIAVIQAGKDNKYNHPHSDVLLRLKESDIEVLRTDQKGDIKIISKGDKLKIHLVE